MSLNKTLYALTKQWSYVSVIFKENVLGTFCFYSPIENCKFKQLKCIEKV